MKVALDATPLVSDTGGVPRYVRELRRGLEGLESGDQFVYLTDQAMPGAIGPRGGWLERKWWLAGLPMALRREAWTYFMGRISRFRMYVCAPRYCPCMTCLPGWMQPGMGPAWSA